MRKTNWLVRIAISLLLTLLLMVVLSTATYAWYSISSRVSTENIVFTADGTAPNGDLAIGFSPDEVTSYSVTFDSPDSLSPMIPVFAPRRNISLADFLNFNTTAQTANEYGELITKFVGTAVEPHILTGGEANEVYLINKNPSVALSVSLSYTLEGELSEKLKMAVFLYEDGDYALKGLLGKNPVYYGAIEAGTKIDDTLRLDDACLSDGELILTVPEKGYVTLKFAIWLDGVCMQDEDGAKETSFSLSFNGIPKEV